jgi:hypothetical protein
MILQIKSIMHIYRLPLPTTKESSLMLCKEALVQDFHKEAVVLEVTHQLPTSTPTPIIKNINLLSLYTMKNRKL